MEKIADYGNIEAQYQLGIIYETAQYTDVSIKWYCAAASHGHKMARAKLTQMANKGYILPQPILDIAFTHENVHNLQQMAGIGNHDALYKLGCMYEHGMYLPKYDNLAVTCYSKAAEKGHQDALKALHNMVKQGHKKAKAMLQDLKKKQIATRNRDEVKMKGTAGARDWFGTLKGETLPPAPPKQQEALQPEMSAEDCFRAGSACYAELIYDIAYHPDPDVAEEDRAADFRNVAMWFRKAAEQGHPGAQYYLGELYRDGRGVSRSDEQKAIWWSKAVKGYREQAEQGDVTAQFELGHLYEDGEVVPRDVEQAAYWYRKAAEQGDPNAMRFLGGMCEEGRGVPQDYEAAAFWYRKLAEVGVGHWAADDLRRLEDQGLIKKRG